MSGGSSHTPGRCLYECLSIARNASDADIKKAYRKAALIWHPDKNVGNEAAAKTAFQEITHAYAVLSDPQERQWYDDHREDILSGDNGGDGEGGGGVSRVPDLWVYFRADAYTGFGDDEENGFYAVYSRAFHEIFEAEESLREGEEAAPKLGRSEAPYVDVAKFYSYWTHFSTKHTFSWEDEYNPNEAPDRRTRRLIEKENARVRAAAKKKYQDEIRALVDFCKRRDRRVLQEKLRLRQAREEEAERKKTDAAAKAKEMARQRALWLKEKARDEEAAAAADGDLAANGVVRLADLSSDDDGRRRGKGKSKGKRGKGAAAAGNGESGAAARRKEQQQEEEAEVEVFRCAVCRKDFKSDKQLSNHEGSKQHNKRLHEVEMQLLREARAASAATREEEGSEESDEESSSGGEASSSDGSQLDDYIDPVIAEIELGFAAADLEGSEGGSSSRKGKSSDFAAAEPSEAAESESVGNGAAAASETGAGGEEESPEASSTAAEGASAGAGDRAGAEAGNGAGDGGDSASGDDGSSEDEEDSDEDENLLPVLDVPAASSRARKNRVPAPAPSKPKAGKRRGKKKDNGNVQPQAAAAAGASGKAGRQKVGRSAAKAYAAAAAKAGATAATASGGANVSALGCRICGAEFASRTKLFSHLSETGHARANV